MPTTTDPRQIGPETPTRTRVRPTRNALRQRADALASMGVFGDADDRVLTIEKVEPGPDPEASPEVYLADEHGEPLNVTIPAAWLVLDGRGQLILQPGQPDEGMGYNPRKSLPYPLFVGPDNRVENVPGYPLVRREEDRGKLPRLAGFQPDVETQRVDVHADRWREDPLVAVGMVPVFHEPDGSGMFSLSVLITDVSAR